jgi:SAM-dependent methyltransferase
MKVQDIVRLYDDAYAAKYEQEFLLDPLVRSDTEAELRLLEQLLAPGVTWLDVACGTGFFLRHFPNVDRAGIDLSPAMLRLARQGNPTILLREHDFRDPIPEWDNRWELVSCMWYAYGFADTVGDLEKLIANLWSWTSMTGRCFIPLADPRLITGVNLPYQAPTHNAGRVMITGILWSYIEDEIGADHAHLLAPNLEFMVELFGQYFECVEIIRYPPAFNGWEGRPALVASGKKHAPDKSPAARSANGFRQPIPSLLENAIAQEAELHCQLDDQQSKNAAAEAVLRGRIAALKQMLDQAGVREMDLCELNAAEQERAAAELLAVEAHCRAQIRSAEGLADKRVEYARAETAVILAHAEQLDRRLAAAQAAIYNRDRRIDSLIRSLSWRVTAPMRFVGRPFARLGRLLRSERIRKH